MQPILKLGAILSFALSVFTWTQTVSAEGLAPICKDFDAAKANLLRGVDLIRDKKLDAALAAFRDSRSLCPSPNNTLNIALVLKELDRPIDALEMLDVLEHDFPKLSSEDATDVKTLRETLDKIVGAAVFDGDYPGAKIFVDGTEVGTIPQARPIRLRIGLRAARVELAGYQPLDLSFVVLPKETVRVAVALAAASTAPKDPPKPPLPLHSMFLGAGLPISPSLGGFVTDCDDTCSAAPGIGALIMGGYRYRVLPALRIGAIAGYAFLWQTRSRAASRLAIDGDVQFADVDDHLFFHGIFLGPEVSTTVDFAKHDLDVGVAFGVMGGPLVNQRTATDGRPTETAATSFDLVPPKDSPTSSFAGFLLSLQASYHTNWSPVAGWPISVNLGLMGFAPGNAPQYEATFTAHFRNAATSDKAANFGERLIGSWCWVFTPSIAMHHDL